MTFPVIKFNSGTGSDTAASGYGPSTAVSGANASFNSTSTVNLSANTPNLSTVAADDVFWGATSAGRQWSRIVSVDDTLDTVTCEDAYTVTESNKIWGIGGKRALLAQTNSVKLGNSSNAKPGWIIEVEANQTNTTAFTLGAAGDTTTGLITIRGNSAVTRPILTQSANAHCITVNNVGWIIKDLEFHNTNATKTTCSALNLTASGGLSVTNCILGNATNKVAYGMFQSSNAIVCYMSNSIITDCAIDGINSSTASSFSISNSIIKNCAGAGITGGINAGRRRIAYCLIYGNTGDGLNLPTNLEIDVVNCTIHGNGGDGIDLTAAGGTTVRGYVIFNNNITGNGGYGISAASTAEQFRTFVDYNNFGSGGLINTLGSMNNLAAGANDKAVDPGYVNAAGGNFAVTAAL